MITILSDNEKQSIGNRLYELINEKGFYAEYISTTGFNIKPCYSCGGCSTKTYGKCVLVDDMDPILRKLIRTDTLILLTPVTWGGFSSNIKKVLDRIAIIGDSHYHVKNGELIKRMRCNIKQMFTIGVKDNCSTEEKDDFVALLHENITIMDISGKAFVVNEESRIEPIAEEICR